MHIVNLGTKSLLGLLKDFLHVSLCSHYYAQYTFLYVHKCSFPFSNTCSFPFFNPASNRLPPSLRLVHMIQSPSSDNCPSTLNIPQSTALSLSLMPPHSTHSHSLCQATLPILSECEHCYLYTRKLQFPGCTVGTRNPSRLRYIICARHWEYNDE